MDYVQQSPLVSVVGVAEKACSFLLRATAGPNRRDFAAGRIQKNYLASSPLAAVFGASARGGFDPAAVELGSEQAQFPGGTVPGEEQSWGGAGQKRSDPSAKKSPRAARSSKFAASSAGRRRLQRRAGLVGGEPQPHWRGGGETRKRRRPCSHFAA